MARSCFSRSAGLRVALFAAVAASGALGLPHSSVAQPAPAPTSARDVDSQPFLAQVKRIVQAMEQLGEPFNATERRALDEATSLGGSQGVLGVQAVLDAHVLFSVTINPEMRVSVARGATKAELVEQGWRQFLVKVVNQSGTTAKLLVVSPNAQSVFKSQRETASDVHYHHRESTSDAPAAELWLDLQTFDAQPLQPTLSGLAIEYRIVQLYSRDAGQREAKFSFSVGQGTQDVGFRNDVDVLFTCHSARELTWHVLDENRQPTTAAFTIRDRAGRIYPSQAKRLAPDFGFHPQVYRSDGETVRLPDGEYQIRWDRGPESISQERRVQIRSDTRELTFNIQRWIDPSTFGWWSGDHHIHAAGCSHYTNPSEGVLADDMARHTQGEDLKVGANLTWGPGFDYQKQFFTGADDKASRYPYLLHYDIEVSGFGSDRSGHLCLLRLREQMYPGGDSYRHWPTLGLNTLRWAKKQGALAGPAHSGWGLQPTQIDTRGVGEGQSSPPKSKGTDLPNFLLPEYSGIGANEYIMDVTHEVPGPDGALVPAVDFISTVDTPSVWELNIWYHTLNAGFRTRISGETDFPCVYDERVGLGRSYVKLDGKLNYEAWCEGIRSGRNYVGDGRSHLMEFTASVTEAVPKGAAASVARMGEGGSELKLATPGKVRLTARVAAKLADVPDEQVQRANYWQKPYWSIERARIGTTREVPVEVVLNGIPVARQTIVADGTLRDLSFEVPVEQSSWVALRVLPSSHTNPIWILVGDKPVRASRRSIDWCLKGVDRCWSQKERFIAAAELPQARLDYEHARQVYRARLAEAKAE